MTTSLRKGLRALGALTLVTAVALPVEAQFTRAQPHALTNVSLDRTGASEARWTILLENGRITAVQPAEEAVPAGMRLIDAEGAIALPAFLDAYTRKGVETPEPVKDQDRPLDERSDVRIDMRQANRKGIQPSFRAVTALKFEEDMTEDWQKAGFGGACVAPSGQLLSGSGAFVAMRDAAARDLVLRPEVFAHGAFRATGAGYPNTLMGFTAQLRQFFLDAGYQVDMAKRYEDGRPAVRPAFDDELASGAVLLAGERRLAVEAQSSRDIERWIRLAGEFGVRLAVCGGGEAWRVTDALAQDGIPVVLTLEWGDEVDDPAAKEEEEAEEDNSDDTAEEEVSSEEESDPEPAAEEGIEWEYTEPLGVRMERRRLWEEKRDNAIRLHEAGVAFAFGTSSGSPDDLMENVRALVENGLPADAALQGLTAGAAQVLGLENRLGKLESGFDATLALWSADPLTDEKAKVRWIFVDGFPTEFEVEKGLEGEPADGVDLTGEWTLTYKRESEDVEATLVLEMKEDGAVSGTFTTENPFGGDDLSGDVTGQVAGNEAQLDFELSVQNFKIPIEIKGTIDGDDMEGKMISRPTWSEESDTRSFKATKNPEGKAL